MSYEENDGHLLSALKRANQRWQKKNTGKEQVAKKSAGDFVQYKMILPKALHAKVEKEAGKNNRSISGEITARLEESFRPQRQEAVHLTDADLERIADRVGKGATYSPDQVALSLSREDMHSFVLKVDRRLLDDLAKRTEWGNPAHEVQAEESPPDQADAKTRLERLAKKASGLFDEHAKRLPRDQAETETQVEKGNDRE
jgi:Arc-like DNA binding dprotein